MRIEQEFEHDDPTDRGLAWVGDETVADVRDAVREAARERIIDPGPSGEPASAETRARIREQLASQHGWDTTQSSVLRVPCRRHAARPGEWCRVAGRPRFGHLCEFRRDTVGAPG